MQKVHVLQEDLLWDISIEVTSKGCVHLWLHDVGMLLLAGRCLHRPQGDTDQVCHYTSFPRDSSTVHYYSIQPETKATVWFGSLKFTGVVQYPV